MSLSKAEYKARCEKKVSDARIERLQKKVQDMLGEIYGLEAQLSKAKALLKENNISVEF